MPYDFHVVGLFTLPQLVAGVVTPPLKVAEANQNRRELYLVSYVNDFFIVEDAAPHDANECFRVPGNIGRVFVMGRAPITDTGPIYLAGAAAAVTVFVAELVEIQGEQT